MNINYDLIRASQRMLDKVSFMGKSIWSNSVASQQYLPLTCHSLENTITDELDSMTKKLLDAVVIPSFRLCLTVVESSGHLIIYINRQPNPKNDDITEFCTIAEIILVYLKVLYKVAKYRHTLFSDATIHIMYRKKLNINHLPHYSTIFGMRNGSLFADGKYSIMACLNVKWKRITLKSQVKDVMCRIADDVISIIKRMEIMECRKENSFLSWLPRAILADIFELKTEDGIRSGYSLYFYFAV